ncbi:MAG: hypothetical protein Q9227_001731 [Pyrenula ochraceoflavens]
MNQWSLFPSSGRSSPRSSGCLTSKPAARTDGAFKDDTKDYFQAPTQVDFVKESRRSSVNTFTEDFTSYVDSRMSVDSTTDFISPLKTYSVLSPYNEDPSQSLDNRGPFTQNAKYSVYQPLEAPQYSFADNLHRPSDASTYSCDETKYQHSEGAEDNDHGPFPQSSYDFHIDRQLPKTPYRLQTPNSISQQRTSKPVQRSRARTGPSQESVYPITLSRPASPRKGHLSSSSEPSTDTCLHNRMPSTSSWVSGTTMQSSYRPVTPPNAHSLAKWDTPLYPPRSSSYQKSLSPNSIYSASTAVCSLASTSTSPNLARESQSAALTPSQSPNTSPRHFRGTPPRQALGYHENMAAYYKHLAKPLPQSTLPSSPTSFSASPARAPSAQHPFAEAHRLSTLNTRSPALSLRNKSRYPSPWSCAGTNKFETAHSSWASNNSQTSATCTSTRQPELFSTAPTTPRLDSSAEGGLASLFPLLQQQAHSKSNDAMAKIPSSGFDWDDGPSSTGSGKSKPTTAATLIKKVKSLGNIKRPAGTSGEAVPALPTRPDKLDVGTAYRRRSAVASTRDLSPGFSLNPNIDHESKTKEIPNGHNPIRRSRPTNDSSFYPAPNLFSHPKARLTTMSPVNHAHPPSPALNGTFQTLTTLAPMSPPTCSSTKPDNTPSSNPFPLHHPPSSRMTIIDSPTRIPRPSRPNFERSLTAVPTLGYGQPANLIDVQNPSHGVSAPNPPWTTQLIRGRALTRADTPRLLESAIIDGESSTTMTLPEEPKSNSVMKGAVAPDLNSASTTKKLIKKDRLRVLDRNAHGLETSSLHDRAGEGKERDGFWKGRWRKWTGKSKQTPEEANDGSFI